MARMTCKCGMQLNNQLAPNDVELWVYTDKEWDKIMTPDVISPWMIPSPKYEVWRCPKCKRIYVYKPGENKPLMTYCLEE